MFLSNQVIDIESDDSRNFCFMVPMEYIFEDFIFGFISDKWPELRIRNQSTDYLALNEGEEVFQIRNDIYIDDLLIIDTKYKIRSNDDGLKAGVSQSDLYQMVSYSIRRNCKNVLLLYPYIESAQNAPTLFKVPSEMLSEELNIQVESIDITFDDLQLADDLIIRRVKGLNSIFN